jgi:hypothetical protein
MSRAAVCIFLALCVAVVAAETVRPSRYSSFGVAACLFCLCLRLPQTACLPLYLVGASRQTANDPAIEATSNKMLAEWAHVQDLQQQVAEGKIPATPELTAAFAAANQKFGNVDKVVDAAWDKTPEGHAAHTQQAANNIGDALDSTVQQWQGVLAIQKRIDEGQLVPSPELAAAIAHAGDEVRRVNAGVEDIASYTPTAIHDKQQQIAALAAQNQRTNAEIAQNLAAIVELGTQNAANIAANAQALHSTPPPPPPPSPPQADALHAVQVAELHKTLAEQLAAQRRTIDEQQRGLEHSVDLLAMRKQMQQMTDALRAKDDAKEEAFRVEIRARRAQADAHARAMVAAQQRARAIAHDRRVALLAQRQRADLELRAREAERAFQLQKEKLELEARARMALIAAQTAASEAARDARNERVVMLSAARRLVF